MELIINGLLAVTVATTVLTFPGAMFVLRSEDIRLYKDLLEAVQGWIPSHLVILGLSTLSSTIVCSSCIFVVLCVASILVYVSSASFWMINLRQLW